MKASEMIKLLQDEQAKRGDVEVLLHGQYGATSDEFEVMGDANVIAEHQKMINIWTGINTG